MQQQHDYKFSQQKNAKRKRTMQVFINNNARFCHKSQEKEKNFPLTLLEECKYEQKKMKMENLINDDLEKSLSDQSGSESDNESNE